MLKIEDISLQSELNSNAVVFQAERARSKAIEQEKNKLQ